MLHARFETWTLVRHALWTFLAIVDFFIGWFECTYACGVRLVTSDELRFGFERIFYFGFIRVLLLVTRSSPLYINFWRFAAESRFFVSLYCRKMIFSALTVLHQFSLSFRLVDIVPHFVLRLLPA